MRQRMLSERWFRHRKCIIKASYKESGFTHWWRTAAGERNWRWCTSLLQPLIWLLTFLFTRDSFHLLLSFLSQPLFFSFSLLLRHKNFRFTFIFDFLFEILLLEHRLSARNVNGTLAVSKQVSSWSVESWQIGCNNEFIRNAWKLSISGVACGCRRCESIHHRPWLGMKIAETFFRCKFSPCNSSWECCLWYTFSHMEHEALFHWFQ